MSALPLNRALPVALATLLAMLAGSLGTTSAQAAAPPIKLVLSNRISGSFEFPEGVAGASGGDVYVVDNGNHRVQELKANGEFVSMFGREVDATTKADICTAASKDVCKKGVLGSAAGEFGEEASSVTVDPVSGDVYVAERVGRGFGRRVQKFTAGGQFVLEIGREVNEKTKGNLCTQAEVEEGTGVKCVGPAEGVGVAGEHGTFTFKSAGNLLAAGGSEDLLYVGDEGRVQKFEANGEPAGEVTLAAGGSVRALALDTQTDDLYVVNAASNLVQRFNVKGETVGPPIEVNPSEEGEGVEATVLAIDSEGHLAVGGQLQRNARLIIFGLLYIASTGQPLPAFTIPSSAIVETLGVRALGFNGNNELYAATGNDQEVLAYTPEFVAELVTGAASCTSGADNGTDATFDCTMNGEVNPEEVSETEAWFQWGTKCSLWQETGKQGLATGSAPTALSAIVGGLPPNEAFCYRLVGEDHNVKSPELLTGAHRSFSTGLVAPRIIGQPAVSFVKASSAVMSGELNPENAASEYLFEYSPDQAALAACAGGRKVSCANVGVSGSGQSGEYGPIATTLEATGLQPATLYYYRLSAESENTAKTEARVATGPEASFTTAPAPVPSAETGGYTALTPTGAIISGRIDPDGLPASYSFELGVYNPAGTQYGTVFTGPAGSSASQRSLQLTGLQPGTTYSYRIVVSSGYINNATHTIQGAPNTFTTPGVPSVLTVPVPPPLLALPNIAFPRIFASDRAAKPPSSGPKLARALKACKKQKPRSKRVACERQARRKYQKTKQARHRKG